MEHTDPQQPLLWLRDGTGISGSGEALRLTFEGPDRIAAAAETWRQLCARATHTGDALGTGTGLIAFCAFTFSEHSARHSVLIVPRVLHGVRDGTGWRTEVSVDAANPTQPDAPARRPATPAAAGTAQPAAPKTADSAATGTAQPARGLEFSPGRMPPAAYLAAVTAAGTHIGQHELHKVVLARDITAQLPEGFDLRGPLQRLSERYPTCWTFAVDGLLGASPETLIRVRRGEAAARVLAGTLPRASRIDRAAHDAAHHGPHDAAHHGPHDGPHDAAHRAAELTASEKDQAEHRYAVDSVRAAIAPWVERLEISERPFVLALPELWHLASDVRATLTGAATTLDLAAALHPTAAVAGTPTSAAVRLIEQLEPFDRGRYAGAVGWVGTGGDGELAVALRCAQVDADGTITAYAGGGIVAGSDPETELFETETKLRPVREAFER